MAQSHHGTPCWYELSTSDPNAAQGFYNALLGWSWADAGMEGFDYRLAKSDGDMVAGMMKAQDPGPGPSWMIYFATDDCDSTTAAVVADGGKVHQPPTDIPGTGRFAVLADPQGVAFGLLQPAPGGQGGAFDQKKTGHGNWHELTTPDQKSALGFYGKHFGWKASSAMDMGPMGTYQVFSHNGDDIGGMMGLGDAPAAHWRPYFGAESIDAAIARINANGGAVLHGPVEVPGGAWIAMARDPQGAQFAVVGPK